MMVFCVICRYCNIPANWQPPKKKEFVERVRVCVCVCGEGECESVWRGDMGVSGEGECAPLPYPHISFLSSLTSPLPQGNLRSWLLDENCYDQCAVIYNAGETVAISQSTPHEIKVVTERKVSLRHFSGSCYHSSIGMGCVPHLASPPNGSPGEIHLRGSDCFLLALPM